MKVLSCWRRLHYETNMVHTFSTCNNSYILPLSHLSTRIKFSTFSRYIKPPNPLSIFPPPTCAAMRASSMAWKVVSSSFAARGMSRVWSRPHSHSTSSSVSHRDWPPREEWEEIIITDGILQKASFNGFRPLHDSTHWTWKLTSGLCNICIHLREASHPISVYKWVICYWWVILISCDGSVIYTCSPGADAAVAEAYCTPHWGRSEKEEEVHGYSRLRRTIPIG